MPVLTAKYYFKRRNLIISNYLTLFFRKVSMKLITHVISVVHGERMILLAFLHTFTQATFWLVRETKTAIRPPYSIDLFYCSAPSRLIHDGHSTMFFPENESISLKALFYVSKMIVSLKNRVPSLMWDLWFSTFRSQIGTICTRIQRPEGKIYIAS